jgi:hypothetical protein
MTTREKAAALREWIGAGRNVTGVSCTRGAHVALRPSTRGLYRLRLEVL